MLIGELGYARRVSQRQAKAKTIYRGIDRGVIRIDNLLRLRRNTPS